MKLPTLSSSPPWPILLQNLLTPIINVLARMYSPLTPRAARAQSFATRPLMPHLLRPVNFGITEQYAFSVFSSNMLAPPLTVHCADVKILFSRWHRLSKKESRWLDSWMEEIYQHQIRQGEQQGRCRYSHQIRFVWRLLVLHWYRLFGYHRSRWSYHELGLDRCNLGSC